jgi:methylated-DNA-[protein]-cysteine S-methyltransferase
VIDLPFGRIGIRADHDGVAAIVLVSVKTALKAADNPMAKRVCAGLRRYSQDASHRFDLPLNVSGTSFQKRVWHALASISPGRPRTYGWLAHKLGTSARAVGGACRRNPVPIIVPCHRVTAVSGSGGYMGQTGGPAMTMKNWLLSHEAGN